MRRTSLWNGTDREKKKDDATTVQNVFLPFVMKHVRFLGFYFHSCSQLYNTIDSTVHEGAQHVCPPPFHTPRERLDPTLMRPFENQLA